jgi:hypothetical protein
VLAPDPPTPQAVAALVSQLGVNDRGYMHKPIPRGENWQPGWCYCSLWGKNPQVLENQGVPRGFCGFCVVCGQPGHTLHFPGSLSFTGAWCKFHYYRTMILHPLGAIGSILWSAIVISGLIALGMIVRK